MNALKALLAFFVVICIAGAVTAQHEMSLYQKEHAAKLQVEWAKNQQQVQLRQCQDILQKEYDALVNFPIHPIGDGTYAIVSKREALKDLAPLGSDLGDSFVKECEK